MSTQATGDARMGMAWWNACSPAARARYLAAAGSAVPAAAWECFKATSARPAPGIEQYDTSNTQAGATPAALGATS